ncbi:hypothetical protein [Chishuiella sp.]|nr:hypothetical protein [Chishuiella sp.]
MNIHRLVLFTFKTNLNIISSRKGTIKTIVKIEYPFILLVDFVKRSEIDG